VPKRMSIAGGEVFIVDNSDEEWKVARYLHDWCQIAKSIDIATGYFDIGSLLALKDEWEKRSHSNPHEMRYRSEYGRSMSIRHDRKYELRQQKVVADYFVCTSRRGTPMKTAVKRAESFCCDPVPCESQWLQVSHLCVLKRHTMK